MTIQPQQNFSWFYKLSSLFSSKKNYKKAPPKKQGVHHNLKELFDELNIKYFSESLNLSIEWSGRGLTRSHSVIRLGYYNQKTQAIKVSRILDRPHVPKYFVSFIIYHEILHHLFPPIHSLGSKRKIHHFVFLQKEREFQEYEIAQTFLKEFQKQLFAHKKL